jgi:hypothetical protein
MKRFVVGQDPRMVKHLYGSDFKEIEDLLDQIIEFFPHCIPSIPSKYLKIEHLQRACDVDQRLVKHAMKSIKEIGDPFWNLTVSIVRTNPGIIEVFGYVYDKAQKGILMEALKMNPDSIRHIESPTRAMKEYVSSRREKTGQD